MARACWRARSAPVLAALALLIGTAPAGADTPDPSPWPERPGADPGIDATAHSVRIAGPDRVQTSQSAALVLRGKGTYPFGTADRTSGLAVPLADASQWWGLGACPFAVIITAGDTVADSLAAASLSDPTDRSTEPRLVRSASANPTFDRVGDSALVDTDSAPIIVTASARQGATQLSAAARESVADLADGGCKTVNAAIVVGGRNAVPAGVEQQLLGFVDQVFRVAGSDRFGTAAAIARSLGTGEQPTSTSCDDPDATDGSARMGFYGNAAVELRSGPEQCRVLGRTVALTDGTTGADALAAGWWTSTWQVPVLLTDGSGNLPPATVEAMNALVIDNVVVLGGQTRVPESTVAQVRAITGAEAHRIAGPDRYATSVAMAETFGGWFPTGDGSDHDAAMVCLAASSGSGRSSVGWADALGAGPWCAEAGGLASGTPAPARGLPPVSGPNPRVTRAGTPSHDAVPVLLTPVGTTALPDPVAALLDRTFDPADRWCSSLQPSDACLDPGFIVAFGGPAVVTDGALRQAARAVSGQTYVAFDDQTPSAGAAFWTELDLRPVYANGGVSEEETVGRVCVDRGSMESVRWLALYADASAKAFGAEHDLLGTGRYVADRDGVPRTPGEHAPVCVRAPEMPGDIVNAQGVSLSGNFADAGTFDTAEVRRLELSGALAHPSSARGAGVDSRLDPGDGGSTSLDFAGEQPDGLSASVRSTSAAVTAGSVRLTLVRGTTESEPDVFTASVSIDTSLGTIVGSAAGEGQLIDGVWQLRGRFDLPTGASTTGPGGGGFIAELTPSGEGFDDDTLRWQVDAVLGS